MERIVEILAGSLTDQEVGALKALAAAPTVTSNADIQSLIKLRLVDQVTGGNKTSLAPLGAQVLAQILRKRACSAEYRIAC